MERRAADIGKESISDCYVYRKILSPTEGATLMARGYVAGATAHWPFNETVYDNTHKFYNVVSDAYHLITTNVTSAKRAYGIQGSRYLLDKGYTKYRNAITGDIYVGYSYAGAQLLADTIVGTTTFTKVANYAANLTNHNLADSYILFAGDSWDRSDTAIWSAATRAGWYLAATPKSWFIDELNQVNLNNLLNTAYKDIVFVKVNVNSVNNRVYLEELFSFNQPMTGNFLQQTYEYTGDDSFFFDINPIVGNDYFTSQASDFPLAHMNLYGGEYYDGRTYICYQGDDDDIYIRYYDHVKNHWSTETFVAINPTMNGGQHGEGYLCVDALGYIHIIYAGFNNVNGYETLLHAKSKFIREIEEWVHVAAPGVTEGGLFHGIYPQLFKLSTGRLLCFFKGRGDVDPTQWGYQTSDDNGLSWSAFVPVFYNFLYAKAKLDSSDNIHVILFADHLQGIDRQDIYYAWFDGTNWKNNGGTNLTLPYDQESMGDPILIYDSAPEYNQNLSFDLDSSNKPVVIFNLGHDLDGVYAHICLKWNGAAWVTSDLGVTTHYWRNHPTAIRVIDDNNFEAYLTVTDIQEVGGNIEEWKTSDGGTTWAKIQTLLLGKYLEPLYIKNFHGNAKIVIPEYRNDATTWTGEIYLWGTTGFIKS